MKRRVYRSLDNPSSLLGIKGIFLVGLLVCLAVVGFFSLLIGAASSSIVGTLPVEEKQKKKTEEVQNQPAKGKRLVVDGLDWSSLRKHRK